MEMSERQIRDIEGATSRMSIAHDQPVAAIRRAVGRGRRLTTPQQPSQAGVCRNCGGRFPHPGGRSTCPAYGVICNQCSKVGHYARCCRSQPANEPTWRHTHTVRTEAASRRDDLAISMINRVKRHNLVTTDLAAGRSTR